MGSSGRKLTGGGGGTATVTTDRVPLQLASGSAYAGDNAVAGGILMPTATNVVQLVLHADTAPVGGALQVNLHDSAGYVYGTVTLAAGQTDVTATLANPIRVPAGTRLLVNLVTVGATSAAAGVMLDVFTDSAAANTVPATVAGLTMEPWNTLSASYRTIGSPDAPVITAGVWQVTFAAGDSENQDQFAQTDAKTLIPVGPYAAGASFVVMQRVLTPPTVDTQTVGLYFSNGTDNATAAAKWAYLFANHYSGSGNARMYHQAVWFNGTAPTKATGVGGSVESSDTNYPVAMWQRVSRTGSVWKYETSPDGSTWTQKFQIDLGADDFAVSWVGPIASHASSTAWTCQVDATYYQ